MKAAQLIAYDGPSAVKFNSEVAEPVPADNQVLVQVHAAAANPFDYKVSEGRSRLSEDVSFPATLGGDLAGTVLAVGSQVSDFSIGQAVFGQANALSGQGSFAEAAPIAAAQLAIKPENVDFITAAALPLAACSAYQAIVDHLNLQADQKILIHGGAGGIGSFAVQISHNLGAHVIATAAGADSDFVKSLGADEVIDYTSQDFAELVHDCDAVFDTVGGETNAKSYGVLKPGGRLVSMIEPADETQASQRQITYTRQSSKVTSERLQQIGKMVEQDTLHVNIDKVFPLEKAGEALAYLQTGHHRGKVVIEVISATD